MAASIYPERIDYFEMADRALKREGLPVTDYVFQFFGGYPGSATSSALVSYSEHKRYVIPVKDSFGVTVNEDPQANYYFSTLDLTDEAGNINIEKGKAYYFEEYVPNFISIERAAAGADHEVYEIGMERDDSQYTYKVEKTFLTRIVFS